MFDAAGRAIFHINSLDCQRTYDREVTPGDVTGALHHVALRLTGYEEMKARLDARGADYKENLVVLVFFLHSSLFFTSPQLFAARLHATVHNVLQLDGPSAPRRLCTPRRWLRHYF